MTQPATADPATADPGRARHVAIIMDGNGRWAKRRHLPRAIGHQRGVEAVRRLVREGAYGSWFSRVGFHGIDNGVLTLSTLSQIAADRIKRDYVDAILHAAEVAEVVVDRVIITLRKDRR